MANRDSSKLQLLRDQILDPSVATTDCLRTALLLGGDSGSLALREWARAELNGYGGAAQVPPYRTIHAGICYDIVSGFNHARGLPINSFELPTRAEVSQELVLNQPLAELVRLASNESTIRFQNNRLDYARLLLNQQDDDLQQVLNVYYVVDSATINGVVDRVRNNLVELAVALGIGAVPSSQRADDAV